VKRLALSYAGHRSDRVEDLFDGCVEPDGIELHCLALPIEEAFHRMWENLEFDASEMSLSTYLTTVAADDHRWIAIPVFPSRMFRHHAIYVHTAAGIDHPQALRGKRVGVPEYQQTAAVWIRGFLEEQHGVPPSAITWYVGGLHDPGRLEMGPVEIAGVSVHRVEDRTLNDLLVQGEIDALISARTPRAFAEGRPEVARLFPNYKQAEMEFYKQTRLFPIMHTVVIRRPLYERHPWVAVSLYRAFEEAKNRALERLHQGTALSVSLPWLLPAWEETQSLLGKDFWPYGLEANRRELETLARYAFRQGLTSRLIRPEELFAPNVLNLERMRRT
jgi:4,5-dihydroxyphthalate decarboxylase